MAETSGGDASSEVDSPSRGEVRGGFKEAHVMPLSEADRGEGEGRKGESPVADIPRPCWAAVNKTPSELQPKNCFHRAVDHRFFDYGAGLLIVLNALVIGAQTEYAAVELASSSPLVFEILDVIFCTAFAAELAVRLLAYGRRFFTMSGRLWNLFDIVLVGLQVLEKAVQASAGEGESAAVRNSGFSAMRMLRILRVIRIVRLVRVLRLITELRTIVICIAGSMKSLIWTVVLLLLMIYITAVYLTQLVSDYRIDIKREATAGDVELRRFYGSLFRSVLTLYQSISGGLSWDDAVVPLIKQVSPMLGVFFALYIAFAILAIMNVVTGVFVETSLQTAKRDQDVYMVHNVRELFSKTDTDGDGHITWDEFQGQLSSPELQETLKLLDIDAGEARELFQLIDIEEKHMVSFDDFINGCMRLKGPAKSIDLMTVMYEHRRVCKRMRGVEVAMQALHQLFAGRSDNSAGSPITASFRKVPAGAIPPLPLQPRQLS